QIAIRPGLSKAGDGAIDQPRVARRELLVVDPEPLGDAWPVFLDDNVGVPGEAKVDFLARSALEIDPDRLLVAAKRVVRRAAEAVDRPLRAGGAGLLRASSGGRSRLLDLDHFSAKVRQDHRAERSRRELGQVEYFDSVQWCGHRGAALLVRVYRLRKRIRRRDVVRIVFGTVEDLRHNRLIDAGGILLVRLIAVGVLIVVGAIV